MLYFTAFANSLNPWFPTGAQIHTESLGESYLKFLSIHITHLSCASVWSAERWWPGRQVSGSGRATPGPQPFCRTGSQSKSLYVRLFLSPWLRSLLVFEMWQITLNDPFLFPPHADLICLWKGLSHTPSSQAIWKSCNFESVWEISSSGCKEAKVQDHFQASVAE